MTKCESINIVHALCNKHVKLERELQTVFSKPLLLTIWYANAMQPIK